MADVLQIKDLKVYLDVDAGTVQLRPVAHEQVGHLSGDELLHVLVRAIVVRAVGQGRGDPVRADPGAHQHVRACLARRIRARRIVGRLLGELIDRIEREISEDLVRGDVVETALMLADRFQNGERPDDVTADEW